MKELKVSIIIPVYNGSNYLREAIDSALGQSYKNCEVIVVNDGSEDGGLTEHIALAYGDKIRYFKKRNGGVASALNLGIKKMTGDYFSWLSHDDLYYKDKVKLQVEALLNSGQEKGIVYSDYTVWETETNIKTNSDFLSVYDLEDLNNGFFSVWMATVHGCALLIHKSYFERVGPFNESLQTTQDHEMWFRIMQEVSLIFVPQPLIIARRHREQGSKTNPICYKERTDLFLNYLDKMNEEKIKEAFGSKYKFYSMLLEQFFLSELYECMDKVKERLVKLPEPDKVKEEVRGFQSCLQQKLGVNANNIGIWGCGFRGRLLRIRLFLRGIKIKAFIDNNPNMQGKEIEGIQCLAPNEIAAGDMGIIISIKDAKEIMDQLDTLFVKKYLCSTSIEKKLSYTGILKDCIRDLGVNHALD